MRLIFVILNDPKVYKIYSFFLVLAQPSKKFIFLSNLKKNFSEFSPFEFGGLHKIYLKFESWKKTLKLYEERTKKREKKKERTTLRERERERERGTLQQASHSWRTKLFLSHFLLLNTETIFYIWKLFEPDDLNNGHFVHFLNGNLNCLNIASTRH